MCTKLFQLTLLEDVVVRCGYHNSHIHGRRAALSSKQIVYLINNIDGQKCYSKRNIPVKQIGVEMYVFSAASHKEVILHTETLTHALVLPIFVIMFFNLVPLSCHNACCMVHLQYFFFFFCNTEHNVQSFFFCSTLLVHLQDFTLHA